MDFYIFIFSGERRMRITRHTSFWIARFIFLLLTNMIFLNQSPGLYLLRDHFAESLAISWWTILGEMVLIYALFYWLPKTRTSGFKKFFSVVGALTLSTAVFIGEYPVLIIIMRLQDFPPNAFWTIWNCLMYYSSTSLAMVGLFLAFKMFKNFYLKMEETEMLEQENAVAEVKWLKAQVHPHFLFNTLNNIYSSILVKSPIAGRLLDNLSRLLRYMIQEHDEPFVLLDKEILLLRDYIGLQQVRYDERLKVQMVITGEHERKLIAPLLLIPFLENAFKHGVSKLNSEKSINILIEIKNDRLFYNIDNSKPNAPKMTEKKNGIGLQNVGKRLQYIYHDKFDLRIVETENLFEVTLELPLMKQEDSDPVPLIAVKLPGYA